MKFITVGFVVLVVFGGAFFYLKKQSSKSIFAPIPSPTLRIPTITVGRVEAYFKIYTNGTKRDFSAEKYHNKSPDAYIEAPDSTRIVVDKPGTVWQEFFDTLPSPFKISSECLFTGTGQKFCNTETKKLKFLLNGQEDINVLSSPIKNGDKLVVRYE